MTDTEMDEMVKDYRFATIGKGKSYHLSKGSDGTLCSSGRGKELSYVSGEDIPKLNPCKRCYPIAEGLYAYDKRIAYLVMRDAELDRQSWGNQSDDYDWTAGICTHRRVIDSQGGQSYTCRECEAESREREMRESIDGPMTGQHDDYDYAADETRLVESESLPKVQENGPDPSLETYGNPDDTTDHEDVPLADWERELLEWGESLPVLEETSYCQTCESTIVCYFKYLHSSPCYECGSEDHAMCQHEYEIIDEMGDSLPEMGDSYEMGISDEMGFTEIACEYDEMEDSFEMEETISDVVMVSAHLQVIVSEGVTVDLGWHAFTLYNQPDDKSIAERYGELYGTGNPVGGWSSIIRVVELCWL